MEEIISPRCSLKIVLHKAFDSIHWGFIFDILKTLNLPHTFIAWIEACFTQTRFSISFNGTLIGYFKGAKGLRQRDPLSPYLFVLAMNILSRMLNLAAERGIFGFHPKTRKIGLTHLSFADDLLIFCKGNIESVVGVLSILDQFYEVSRLKLNSFKCEIFSAGIHARTIEKVKLITGFQVGILHVHYLGIPLVTLKLTEKDCQALIDNIKRKLHIWSGRNISYAGRLELINSVLFNISNYWCRQLVLPASILKKVEQICSRFFWKGADKSAAGARISWGEITVPKSEGGLGLKNIKTWNRACLLSLIQKILTGNGSLWVAWLKAYVFKEHEFWQYQAGVNVRWSIRRLLKLRTEASPIILSNPVQTRDIWNLIRFKEQKVTWHKLTWFPLHIPKLSLIAWMIILNRLPTRDRLNTMGICTDLHCVNCDTNMESRDHLFMQCPLAADLWNAILKLNGMNSSSMTWVEMVSKASSTWKGRSLLTTILKISWTVFLYFI
ncbi:uncharacterized protein LOC120217411 [Hibiscus syriacus]|uniref:uncharacterized protein LOC120217411 n=1 Tax=Hibiscus syriacus TaxID=106335 RepID=UPI001923BAA9|nr:uncharacterized protein LOC120217411 [Hibiscus syriacus]